MNRVELLAPAGDMDCFKAAIRAGADAVYMAGKTFGARASANNFTEEEFIEALNVAHIHGRRIFLTLNTLIKEKEWDNIYDFLKPLYEAGLDGVIIQDMGLIDYLSRAFPKLELHASTQMTITHESSANYLKEKGICRIVPARELSLQEIKELKAATGLEIECFIHGALCYCYSGQCLFSSYLGGRSGNRGRCAGPCRLPYSVKDYKGRTVAKDEYPLSLKDLCTIDHISELIEASIDSFKIEGRMKSPEYVYGVTSIYRKYIDAYYEGRPTKVGDEDRHTLKCLYLRSSIGSGYYYTHNGRRMISLTDPSYNNRDESVVASVHGMLQLSTVNISLNALIYAHVGEELLLTVWDNMDNTLVVSGDVVSEATNRAATREDIISKIGKTGGTEFIFDTINVDMDTNCFIPVKSLNELRRNALDQYQNMLLNDNRRIANDKPDIVNETYRPESLSESFQATIMKADQLQALSGYNLDRVYIPYDLIYAGKVADDTIEEFRLANEATDIGIALPRIIRSRDKNYLESLRKYIEDHEYISVLIRNLEELALIRDWGCNCIMNGDYMLYSWNSQSEHFYKKELNELTANVELSLRENRDLKNKGLIIPVYGYVPLMVTANCLAKTYNDCRGDTNDFAYELTDRRGKTEATYSNCLHCYNEVFNALPTSLHNKMEDIRRAGFKNFRLDFTMEKANAIKSVLDIFINGDRGVDYEFTTGHFEKGAI